MTKKILIPMIIGIFGFLGYFLFIVDHSEFQKIDMTEYSIMDVSKLDDKLNNWLKQNKEKEGISYIILEGNTYAYINAGVLGNGSGIIIEEISKNNTKYKIQYDINEVKDEDFKENVSVLIKFKDDLKVIK